MKKILVMLAVLIVLIASTTIAWGAVQGEAQLEQQMLELVNSERAKAGLKPLQMDAKLVELARMKSQDMIDKDYFSHTSPTYGDPFDMMRNYGVNFTMAGENLAGNPSLTGGHEALMNSPGHRANILKPEFTHVGIGVVKGGPYGLMITQMFIKAVGTGNTQPSIAVSTTPKVQLEAPQSKTVVKENSSIKQKDELKVYLNDREVRFPDVKPYINKEQRIMVPIRFISQEMNFNVDWESIDQKIIIKKNSQESINLWIGKNFVQKEGKLFVSDSAPELKHNRTLIPLRMVSELLGSEVIWYPQAYKVEIN